MSRGGGKVVVEVPEACCVCSLGSLELMTPEEHDATAPPHQPPLRAMLLHLNHNKVVPNGRLCPICVRRTVDAYNFSVDLESKGPPPLSEKIRALRKRLHELTQKIDVFIVVGGGAGGAYSERDILAVERGALAAAARAEAGPRAPDARGDPVHQCQLCPLAFQRMSEYRVHASAHAAGGVHWCWSCGAALPDAGALAAHAAQHAPHSLLHCALCNTDTQSAAELRRHEATCPSTCPVCSLLLPSRAALRAHVAALQGDGAGHGALCGECFARSPTEAARAAHALTHRRERHFVCGYRACILRFHTRSNLLAHIRKCHAGEEPEPEPPARPAPPACSLCDKTFASVAALKRHARVHQPKLEENMDVEWTEDAEKVEYLEVETLEDLEQ